MKPVFMNPEEGEHQIKLIEPDTIVECIDNTGMEVQFDTGIEYVFEGEGTSIMISVFNKLGELQTCFADRFRIVSRPLGGFFQHKLRIGAA